MSIPGNIMKRLRPLRSDQGGFTLIELVVGLVLMTIIMAAVGTMLIDAFRHQSKSVATRKAARDAQQTVEQLGTDLRSAKAKDRDADTMPGADALRRNLLEGQAINNGGTTLDVRDIVRATPDELMFRSNVITEPGTQVVECVHYVMEPNGNGQKLMRYVYTDRHDPVDGTNCRSGDPRIKTVLFKTDRRL